ncbi:hypothetical protein [Caballeronia concitans]|uniref:Uncharacterized protein n=1 Tax=Caballeronia concitans TaxID=1777133 RepID=A0A658QUM4_9BURK|nr:hypothetical protein [Caballeronia concitans]KIG09425.1 hypothetical protein BurMR1_3101 [Burkholderia sp. MR1]SAL22769.1 hypothetical protein AWB72_01623 [Caballeronia concitans]
MNTLQRLVATYPDCALRLWSSACLFRLRYGSGLLALPLCSSVCFFGLRLVLSAVGVSV